MMEADVTAGKRQKNNSRRARQGAPTARTTTGRRRKAGPSLRVEKGLLAEGFHLVAGVDEVGRGAWAGPLSVGVAVLRQPPAVVPKGLRDSKELLENFREQLFEAVGAWCTAWAVGHATPQECDRIGMTAALRLATRRAFSQLPLDARPDAVVLDGSFDFVSPPREPTLFDDLSDEMAMDGDAPLVRTVIGGDRLCATVAAASVLAKVTRDRMMRSVADSYPPFDFHRNKGYPSPDHKVALRGYGLTAIHRRSWVFVDSLPWKGTG
jgi:ribonuclease HII